MIGIILIGAISGFVTLALHLIKDSSSNKRTRKMCDTWGLAFLGTTVMMIGMTLLWLAEWTHSEYPLEHDTCLPVALTAGLIGAGQCFMGLS